MLHAQGDMIVFSSVSGFNAKEPYYKLFLFGDKFTFTKAYIEDQTRYYLNIQGKYVTTDAGIRLKSQFKSEFCLTGVDERFSKKNEFLKETELKVDTLDNEQYAEFTFLDDTISLRSYLSPPDSIYKILAGNYMITNENIGYSLEMKLSYPGKNDLGDYGAYFFLAEGEDSGETLIVIKEIAGRYTISNGKLYLHYSLIETIETEYSDNVRSAVDLKIQEEETIPVDFIIGKDSVILNFVFKGEHFHISKPIH